MDSKVETEDGPAGIDGHQETEESPSGRLDALLSGVRFGRFASVGIVGAAVDVTVLLLLSEWLGVLPEIANVISIESAILVMFAINERWTFAEVGNNGLRPLLSRMLRSHGVRLVGSLTQFAIFVVVLRYFTMDLTWGGIDLWLLVAKGTGMALAVVVNYTAETLLTWQVHLEE